MRYGEVDGEGFLIGCEPVGNRPRRRRRVGVGDIEQEAIGEDAGCLREGHGTGSEGLLVDAQPLETPRPEIQRL